jgi:ubiquinone/menaquinone biosynthesis C-methylase UbiE
MSSAAENADITAEAFDGVAATYDGPQGNNELIRRMRDVTWQRMAALFPAGSHLLDLGCGTGIDAEHLVRQGYRVHATDWSAAMVARTADRASSLPPGMLVAERVGAHDLWPLVQRGATFDGAYSNFGPLNCVDDLAGTSAALARLLVPGGRCLFTVIGRVCPWELAHYARRLRWQRATVRFRRGQTPVGMAGGTIWTRYYTPGEFAGRFRDHFDVVSVRALSLFVPPPYLDGVAARWPSAVARAARWDDRVGRWPVLRSAGDHFMIELRRRG